MTNPNCRICNHKPWQDYCDRLGLPKIEDKIEPAEMALGDLNIGEFFQIDFNTKWPVFTVKETDGILVLADLVCPHMLASGVVYQFSPALTVMRLKPYEAKFLHYAHDEFVLPTS